MDKRTRGKRGAPDIIACVPPEGRFLAIELKVADGRLEPAQATEIERIRTAGGCAIVAHTLQRRDRGHLESQEGKLLRATRRTGKGEHHHNITTPNAPQALVPAERSARS